MTIVGAFKVQGVPVLIGDIALMKGEITTCDFRKCRCTAQERPCARCSLGNRRPLSD